MLKKISLALAALTLSFVAVAPFAHAAGFTNGLPEAGVKTGLSTTRTLPEVIGSIISVVLSFLGIIFLLLVIYAGFTWMTAQGDPKAINKAREILTGAVIGLVILLASYAITTTVTKELQKATTGSTAYTGIVHSA